MLFCQSKLEELKFTIRQAKYSLSTTDLQEQSSAGTLLQDAGGKLKTTDINGLK